MRGGHYKVRDNTRCASEAWQLHKHKIIALVALTCAAVVVCHFFVAPVVLIAVVNWVTANAVGEGIFGAAVGAGGMISTAYELKQKRDEADITASRKFEEIVQILSMLSILPTGESFSHSMVSKADSDRILGDGVSEYYGDCQGDRLVRTGDVEFDALFISGEGVVSTVN